MNLKDYTYEKNTYFKTTSFGEDLRTYAGKVRLS